MNSGEVGMYAVRIKDLKKVYKSGDTELTVLNSLDMAIKQGTIAAVVGRSGSGKTTLLNLIGGLDRPTSGTIIVKDTHFEQAAEDELSDIRNRYIGFVFQFHNLLSEFTVLENIMIPNLLQQNNVDYAYSRAVELLSLMEILPKKNMKPNHLSGGESQRVAIARALINNPEIILADEPTGDLDIATAEKIKNLLFNIVRKFGHTLLIVTHNPSVVSDTDVTYRLHTGSLNTLLDNFN